MVWSNHLLVIYFGAKHFILRVCAPRLFFGDRFRGRPCGTVVRASSENVCLYRSICCVTWVVLTTPLLLCFPVGASDRIGSGTSGRALHTAFHSSLQWIKNGLLAF